MKSYSLPSAILTLSALFFITFSTFAITYTTINSGTWNDITSVWSTNGGASPCGCSPGPMSGSNTVQVNHHLSVPFDLTINGGTLMVGSGGQMTGAYNFNAINATVDVFGYMNLVKYDQSGTSTVTFHPGAILIASNTFTVSAGSATLDAAVINSGKLTINAGASVLLTNTSRFFITSGNSVIDGTLNIGPGSCMESNGNWKIGATGSVLGSGTLNSGGNINNNGFVDLTIIWCSQGAGLGMPTPPDCATAGVICNAIILPVRLTSFEAEVYDNSYSEILWTTASENNSSHFVLQSSKDGDFWLDIARIESHGTTTESQFYGYTDNTIETGITYYRLSQFDVDGKETKYAPISIRVMDSDLPIIAFPNPVNSGTVLNLQNLKNGTGTALLVNFNGQVIRESEFKTENSATTLSTEGIDPGIYLLKIIQNEAVNSLKIVIE